jgi:hypothetical protein
MQFIGFAGLIAVTARPAAAGPSTEFDREPDLATGVSHWMLALMSAVLARHCYSRRLFVEENFMPKFVTIGYGDRAGYDRTPQAVRDDAHAHDAALIESGVLIGIAGQVLQVRNPENTGVRVVEGAFLRSDLPVAGFALLEADTIEAAIEIVSRSPCAVAQGLIEVWPLKVAISS